MEALTKTINEIMTKFIKRVASKYDLNQDEILEMWFEGTSTASRTVSVDGSGCPYVPSRGQNKGVVCGSKPAKDSTHCSVHKKYENKEPKEKKTVPVPKTSGVDKVFKKNLAEVKGYLMNKKTSLLIKDGENQVSKKLLEGKIVDLSSEDIETCKKYGFKYDPKYDKKEDSDEEDEKPSKKVEDSNEEDEKPTKKVEAKPAKKDDSDDEDEKPSKKAETKPAKKVETKKNDSDSDEEDEKPVKKVEAKKPEVKKVEVKPTKKVETKKDDSDSDEEDEKPTKKVEAKKSTVELEDVEDDISSLQDEETTKTSVKKALGISQDDSDDE
jgi:hypothetical protein